MFFQTKEKKKKRTHLSYILSYSVNHAEMALFLNKLFFPQVHYLNESNVGVNEDLSLIAVWVPFDANTFVVLDHQCLV